MAIKISSTTVIDNSRNLANIETFDSTVNSVWDQVTVTDISKTLLNREHCTVATSGQTITLPANPLPGWEVVISVGNFSNTIIGRNGRNIMGLAEDLIFDARNSTLNLIYVDSTRGWRFN